MGNYIKYKRFNETLNVDTLEQFFDNLIENGWNIIYYSEIKMTENKIHVTIVCGKKQNNNAIVL